MDEREYNTQCEKLFAEIESFLDGDYEDLEYDNNEGNLEIFFDSGRRIVVSRQPPLKEIWLADRSGGFHFKMDGGWVDTKSGDAFMERLETCIKLGLAE